MADLAAGSGKAKLAAAAALAEVTSPGERQRAATALIEILESSAPSALRQIAARSLGELGQAEALDPLAKAIEGDDPALRQLAAIAIGNLGLTGGFEILAGAVRESPPDVRFQAARSLGEIDPERALPVLLEAIASESDDEVLGALALGLGEIGDPTAADAIAAHLQSNRSETAFEAAYALALLGDRRGIEIMSMATAERQRAWDALEGLELAGGAVAADALAAAMRRRKVAPELSLRAAGGLLALDPDHEAASEARSALLGGLSAWKHHLRGLATSELGRIGGWWAIGELERLRGRRRGAILIEEIDEALEQIRSRETTS